MRFSHRHSWAFLCSAVIWLAALSSQALALDPPPDLRSLVGENLEFRIHWGIIPAGKASLRVIDAGEGRVTFRAEARTLPYIDTIYPVRDLIESTSLLSGSQALRYYKRSKEGHGKPKESEVLFDAAQGEARLVVDGEARPPLPIPPGVQDPLSCFYYYRAREVPDDAEASFTITDGAKLITAVVRVVRRETIETQAGAFRCVVVEPVMEGIGGIFRKSPGARILIWLTDDRSRRPVRLRSEVAVGHFTAELVKITLPEGPLPDPR